MALLSATVGEPASATTNSIGAYRADDSSNGSAMYILPPGENGLINSQQLSALSSGGPRPTGSADQLGPYANLLYGSGSVTDANVGSYFLDESFGVRPQDVTKVEKPSASVAVTILRDTHQVPHIYGRSMNAMAFGAGYAAGEDRLFFMDVLRHFAE